ncbi:hypothetical protein J8I87_17725 [Paraburkholderia sp. LEh10]|uniref:hypothetical protein n=1 Tax=Paraburkholderia sp. LEh10 TaxID=2821353 RepID=UPI001AE38A34|nr:hypothetical protein [Paraburkholderia sp. LEh10]MBP0591531.1 hypothetical protein [Paraburkholderia sp. LEh10]
MSAKHGNPFRWVAGVVLALSSCTAYANDHARALPIGQPPSILFYSYPPIPSSAYPPQRHLHRYVVASPLHMGNPTYGLYDNYSIAPGYARRFGQLKGNPGLPRPDGAQPGHVQGAPDYGLTPDSPGDEWSFRANPLVNQNHSHERGATFSIRHDF